MQVFSLNITSPIRSWGSVDFHGDFFRLWRSHVPARHKLIKAIPHPQVPDIPMCSGCKFHTRDEKSSR